jgi:hypothetical protein
MKNHFFTFILVISYFSVFSQNQYLTDLDPIRGYNYDFSLMGILNEEESVFELYDEMYLVNSSSKKVEKIEFNSEELYKGAYSREVLHGKSNSKNFFFLSKGNYSSKYMLTDVVYNLHSFHDGEIKTAKLDEGKISNESTIRTLVSEDGIYVILSSWKKEGNELIVYKFDNDLELIWKSEENVTLTNEMEIISSDAAIDNGLVITIKITPNNQNTFTLVGSKLPKSGLAFITYNENGKLNIITPQFPENFYAVTSSFSMKNEEVIGVLFINDLKTANTTSAYNNGYIYLKWNTDGSVKEFKKQYFSYEDVKSDELEAHLNKFRLNESAFGDKEAGMVAMRPRALKATFLLDGSAVCFSSIIGVGFKQALLNSKLIFRISNQGELVWTKFYPGDNPEYFAIASAIIDEATGKIRFLAGTHKGVVTIEEKTFEKNGFRFAIIDRELDLNNGEEVNKEYLDYPDAAGSEIAYIYSGVNSFLILFSRKTSHKVCSVLVD